MEKLWDFFFLREIKALFIGLGKKGSKKSSRAYAIFYPLQNLSKAWAMSGMLCLEPSMLAIDGSSNVDALTMLFYAELPKPPLWLELP